MFFRKLAEWRKQQTEDQTYRLPFFIFIVLLIGLTLWSVWDETFSRRPWKEYQNEFFRLERAKANEEYDEEKRKFESPENHKKYKDLQNRLESMKEGPIDPVQKRAYLDAKGELTQLQFKLQDLSRDSQFAKSRLDAAYYLYERAKLEKSHHESKHKEKVDLLAKKIDDISIKIKEVEVASAPLWKIAQAHDEGMAQSEKELSQMTLKLEMIEKKISDVKAKSPKIEQIVISDLKAVDRCQTCHLGIDRPGFEDPQKYPQPFRTHPKLEILLKKHPPEKFACTICHQGQGPALTVDTAHGEVHHWAYPLLRGSQVESSCRKCHLGTVETPEASRLSEGRVLFASLGCAGCHLAPGYEDAWKVGPELTNLHEKTSLEWTQRWILNPKSFKPTTRMPQFKLKEDEAHAIAHYLASLSQPIPVTGEEQKIIQAGNPEEGKKLFTDLACIACHRIGDVGSAFGPNLSTTGSKVRPEWLYRWLKNPRQHSPHGRMPDMRLKDAEIGHLVSYLVTLKKEGEEGLSMDLTKKTQADPALAAKGLKLMGSLGCHGCHVVQGLENFPRVGAELSSFGAKDLELLFFGYARHIPHAWRDWTFNKIKTPQIYATERIEQKMPNFHLSDEEVNSLVTLLYSFRGDEKVIPLHYRKNLNRIEEDLEKGRRLVRHLNCTGCHMIEGKGAELAPNLEGEGEKAQPDWLFKFLKEPVSIRPWYTVRMPKFNFSDDDAGNIVSYFSALAHAPYPYQFFYFNQVNVPERERKAGEKLFEMFKCMSCHPVSLDPSVKQGSTVGPNLGMTVDRLRHDWIHRWILEPEVIQPGTKMPTNFPKSGEVRISYVPNLLKSPAFAETKKYFEELFGPDLDAFLADPAWQARAMRDHLITMQQNQPSAITSPVSQEPISSAVAKPEQEKSAPSAQESAVSQPTEKSASGYEEW